MYRQVTPFCVPVKLKPQTFEICNLVEHVLRQDHC